MLRDGAAIHLEAGAASLVWFSQKEALIIPGYLIPHPKVNDLVIGDLSKIIRELNVHVYRGLERDLVTMGILC